MAKVILQKGIYFGFYGLYEGIMVQHFPGNDQLTGTNRMEMGMGKVHNDLPGLFSPFQVDGLIAVFFNEVPPCLIRDVQAI